MAQPDVDYQQLPRLKTVHRLATLLWAGPPVGALGFFVWAVAVWTPENTSDSVLDDGDVALVAAVALLIASFPYAILAALVRPGRRWAVIALSAVAGLQWAGLFFVLLYQGLVIWKLVQYGLPAWRTVWWFLLNGAYTTALFLTAYLAAKLAIGMGPAGSRPGGFAVVIPDRRTDAPTAKRAA